VTARNDRRSFPDIQLSASASNRPSSRRASVEFRTRLAGPERRRFVAAQIYGGIIERASYARLTTASSKSNRFPSGQSRPVVVIVVLVAVVVGPRLEALGDLHLVTNAALWFRHSETIRARFSFAP